MKVWVVTAESESGDDYGPVVYTEEPAPQVLKHLAQSWDYDDGDGPGDYGSYVYLVTTAVRVIELCPGCGHLPHKDICPSGCACEYVGYTE